MTERTWEELMAAECEMFATPELDAEYLETMKAEHLAQQAAEAEEYRLERVAWQGEWAFEDEMPLDACPYEEHQIEYKAWRAGYLDAQAMAAHVDDDGGY